MTEPQVRGTDNPVEAFRNRLPPWTGMREEYDAALIWGRRRTVEPLRALVTFLEYELPYWGDMPGQQERHRIYVELLHRARAALDPATPGEEAEDER